MGCGVSKDIDQTVQTTVPRIVTEQGGRGAKRPQIMIREATEVF